MMLSKLLHGAPSRRLNAAAEWQIPVAIRLDICRRDGVKSQLHHSIRTIYSDVDHLAYQRVARWHFLIRLQSIKKS